MLPPFTADGVLPPGIHEATWPDVVQRFGTTDRRRALLAGLRHLLLDLKAAGCRRVYLDGSFVTNEPEPGDYDLCWDTDGVDMTVNPAVLRDPLLYRSEIARIYQGDAYPMKMRPGFGGWTFFEFFQFDVQRMTMKGLISIGLEVEL